MTRGGRETRWKGEQGCAVGHRRAWRNEKRRRPDKGGSGGGERTRSGRRANPATAANGKGEKRGCVVGERGVRGDGAAKARYRPDDAAMPERAGNVATLPPVSNGAGT